MSDMTKAAEIVRRYAVISIAWILLLFPLSASAETFAGTVVAVSDGDTITVLDAAKTQHKVRLSGIDAPEKSQPFGNKAKEALSGLVFRKAVLVEWHKRDRYGRLIGKVMVSPPDAACQKQDCPKTLDVSLTLVTAGLAWHYKRFEKEQSQEDRTRYAFAEQEARARKAGLWRDPSPVPPWDWRKGKGRHK